MKTHNHYQLEHAKSLVLYLVILYFHSHNLFQNILIDCIIQRIEIFCHFSQEFFVLETFQSVFKLHHRLFFLLRRVGIRTTFISCLTFIIFRLHNLLIVFVEVISCVIGVYSHSIMFVKKVLNAILVTIFDHVKLMLLHIDFYKKLTFSKKS